MALVLRGPTPGTDVLRDLIPGRHQLIAGRDAFDRPAMPDAGPADGAAR
jgi:hypothetical protein